MPRTRNPRRVVLERLADMRRTTKRLTDLWDESQRMFAPEHGWVPRPDDKKMENKSLWWDMLRVDAVRLADQAEELRAYAEEQYYIALAKEEG